VSIVPGVAGRGAGEGAGGHGSARTYTDLHGPTRTYTDLHGQARTSTDGGRRKDKGKNAGRGAMEHLPALPSVSVSVSVRDPRGTKGGRPR
jgi:hypothetical protein